MNSKLLAATFLSAALLTTGCVRQRTTEVSIKLNGYGEKVSVVTEPGIKCYIACAPGTEYISFTTGEIEVTINAIDPNQSNRQSTIDGRDAYALVQTSENLPMSGSISVFFQININDTNKSDLEKLYRLIPLERGESSRDYRNRVFGRLALISLTPTQEFYQEISVSDVLQSREEKAAELANRIQTVLNAQGFSFVTANRVNISTLNRGPEAEAAARRFALVDIESRIAKEQERIAETISTTQATYAGITANTLKTFVQAGVGDDSVGLSKLYCYHQVVTNPEFRANFKGTCESGFFGQSLPQPN